MRYNIVIRELQTYKEFDFVTFWQSQALSESLYVFMNACSSFILNRQKSGIDPLI